MHRYISLLLFIGLAWGQDKYPYFSDMSKQLEFEQKKILVENNVDKRQVISGGGSEFNWLSLMSNYQPTYLVSPIQTDFEFVTTFSIQRNGKDISEIDFLRFVGLNNQADSIVANYQDQISKFNLNENLILDRDNYVFRKGMLGGCGALFGFITLVFSDDEMNIESSITNTTGLISLASFTGFYLTKKESFMIEDKNNYPRLESFLSNEQVESISEAYNRKLYNDIKIK